MTKLAGVLLAGGASSRFGAEKAMARFGAGLLMDGPLQALARACDGVAVSARPGSGAESIATTCGYPVLHDEVGAPTGPLAGVLAGLIWARGQGATLLATAPCDAPTLKSGQIAALAEAATRTGGVAAGRSAAGVEPLMAVWSVAGTLETLSADMAAGRHPSVRALLDQLGLTTVDGFDGVNVNAQADLKSLEQTDLQSPGPAHGRMFDFEDDFVRSLRCIPMCVRFKLDATGIKLSLRQWSRFSLEDRQRLRLTACASPAEIAAFRRLLISLISERSDEPYKLLASAPDPDWLAPDCPPAVVSFADDREVAAPSRHAWTSLALLERYALVKLTRDKHENANFVPAMREFGLL